MLKFSSLDVFGNIVIGKKWNPLQLKAILDSLADWNQQGVRILLPAGRVGGERRCHGF
jgi:hypothetical protein